jgi:hypothetical protein
MSECTHIVIPGRAKREPGIQGPHAEPLLDSGLACCARAPE